MFTKVKLEKVTYIIERSIINYHFEIISSPETFEIEKEFDNVYD